jgi:hypothetical protein
MPSPLKSATATADGKLTVVRLEEVIELRPPATGARVTVVSGSLEPSCAIALLLISMNVIVPVGVVVPVPLTVAVNV